MFGKIFNFKGPENSSGRGTVKEGGEYLTSKDEYNLEEAYKLYHDDDELFNDQAELSTDIENWHLGLTDEETTSPTTVEKLEDSSLNKELSAEELREKYNIGEEDLETQAAKSYYLMRDGDPLEEDLGHSDSVDYSKEKYADYRRHQELAIYYESLLISRNPAGLPFNNQEWAKLSTTEQARLGEIYQERQTLIKQIAAHNDSFRRFDRPELSPETEANLVYSTSEDADQPEALNQGVPNYKPQKDWPKYQATIEHLSKKLNSLEKEIVSLEKKMTTKEDFDNIPKYSEADIELQEACLDFLRTRDKQAKNQERVRPVDAKGEVFGNKDILELAQEGAFRKVQETEKIAEGGKEVAGAMFKANFQEEKFNGRRQLFFIDNFYDKNSQQMKFIKYFSVNPILPAGRYAFEPDYSKMFPSQKNPNFVFIPLKLLVTLEPVKKFGEKLKNQVEKNKKN